MHVLLESVFLPWRAPAVQGEHQRQHTEDFDNSRRRLLTKAIDLQAETIPAALADGHSKITSKFNNYYSSNNSRSVLLWSSLRRQSKQLS